MPTRETNFVKQNGRGNHVKAKAEKTGKGQHSRCRGGVMKGKEPTRV